MGGGKGGAGARQTISFFFNLRDDQRGKDGDHAFGGELGKELFLLNSAQTADTPKEPPSAGNAQ